MSESPNSMTSPALRWITLLAVLFALAWFGNIGYRKLVKADEGRYAEIPREMVASGDWTTPRLNDFKYFEKPALQYWATATAYTLFGEREWTARLWTALTGFLGVLLVYLVGNGIFGRPTGFLAASVLGGTAIYVFVGHFLTLDMGVSFFMSGTILACLMALSDGASPAEERNWMLAAWAAMALAVLSKGLIGIVLPGTALLAYVFLQRDWQRLKRMHWLSGLALFLLISVPWFVAVSLANKEFVQFFFVQEHFQRFLTKGHGRYQPAWYFIPVIMIGAMPWLFSLVAGYVNAWRTAPAGHPQASASAAPGAKPFHPTRFLAVWCAIVFLFFSASSSKLGSYILPIFPATALLVALQLQRASRTGLVAQSLFAAVAGAAIWFVAPNLTKSAEPSLPAEMLSAYVPWVAGAGALLALAAVISAALAWRGLRIASAVALSIGGLAFTQVAGSGHESLSPLYSAHNVAQKMLPDLTPDTQVYTVNTFDHTLPYYLKRNVTMVSYKDELTVAIAWEPEKFLPDLAAFEKRWLADRKAFAVFAPSDFAALAAPLKDTMDVISTDPRRVVVKKKAT
jgi:4-amino-4-deoxy-L-arabinose transferase-like glycosyltransferase